MHVITYTRNTTDINTASDINGMRSMSFYVIIITIIIIINICMSIRINNNHKQHMLHQT